MIEQIKFDGKWYDVADNVSVSTEELLQRLEDEETEMMIDLYIEEQLNE